MLLNQQQHAHLRYLPIDNRVFAAEHSYIEILTSDIQALADAGIPIILPAEHGVLPQALLVHHGEGDPLAGHTPALWREYPFSLAASAVGIDTEGNATSHTVLWAEPQVPHWSTDYGEQLFTPTGVPSVFLQGVMERLQDQAKLANHTLALIDLLHQAGALTPAFIEYNGHTHAMYRISMENLEEKLDALNSDLGLLAYYFTMRLHQSQQGLLVAHDTLMPFPPQGSVSQYSRPTLSGEPSPQYATVI